jgi:two-component sensor histidine kinase
MIMDTAVRLENPEINEQDRQYLDQIARAIPLIADISRADILICVPVGGDALQVFAQAQPHSIAPIHRTSLEGERLTRETAGAVFRAISERQYTRALREFLRTGTGGEGALAPIVQEAYPIENAAGQVIGGMLIETNLLESERLKRRSDVFQRALKDLQTMALRGGPAGIATLTPFGEYDGIIVTEADRTIRYMSGIATNLYRNVGYGEALVGRPLMYLETRDDELVARALQERRCLQVELEELGRTWVKKVIPFTRAERGTLFSPAREHLAGAMLLLHDDTDARNRERELLIKTTMIKEVHHRVKNDLQTVASLLRMQSRRMETPEAQNALAEAVNRILSIAVIHEFLSDQDTRVINIRDVGQRIIQQMQAGILDPEQRISLELSGPNIYLPARQATSCALVVNELLQNALEHGFDRGAIPDGTGEPRGTISLTFQDHGDAVGLIVHDDGRALPPDFSLDKVDSLGLKIVQMLVTQDLKGQIDLQSDHGVSAIVRFPKIPLGGEEWNESE